MLHADGKRGRVPVFCALAGLALAGSAACGDDPFQQQWTDTTPDTVTLYSLAAPSLNLPSGFNFTPVPEPVIVESTNSTGQWDVVFDTQDGQLVALAPGAFGIDSRARLAERANAQFAEVEEAPGDTASYTATEPLTLTTSSVYVVRTHQALGLFGVRCVYFAKFQPLRLDAELGELDILYIASPVCNDRRLVPPN